MDFVFFTLIMNSKPVIVVEGTSDMNRLSNLIDADYVICQGSAISDETISYIKELVKHRIVIVLTDPDYPGMKIRDKISQAVPEVKHAYVDRKKSSDGKKLGVAECQKDEIIRALKNYVSYDYEITTNISMEDLYRLHLVGCSEAKKNRSIVQQHFNIGYSNAKTMLKHLNMLGITLEQLEELLNDC